MIELNVWIVTLLLLGGIVVALLLFVAACGVYSAVTGNAIDIKYENGKWQIGTGDDE